MRIWDDENPFSQADILWQISFSTNEASVSLFENIFEEKAFAFSSIAESSHFKIEIITDDPENSNLLSNHKDLIIGEVKIDKLENKDWVVEVSSQISDIKTKYFEIQRNESSSKSNNSIIIDNPKAFGMGEHITTKSCIEALESIFEMESFKPQKILDIGTGTGILAIISKKLWPKAEVIAIDIDNQAIEVAQYHAKRNKVDIKLDMNLDKYTENKFDIIVANILANPLLELSSLIASIVKKDNYLILAGLTKEQQELIEDKYGEYSFKVLHRKEKDNWIIFTMQKYK